MGMMFAVDAVLVADITGHRLGHGFIPRQVASHDLYHSGVRTVPRIDLEVLRTTSYILRSL